MTASRCGFPIPKKGEKHASDETKAMVFRWCQDTLREDGYRRTATDPYGNPAFVVAVGEVFNPNFKAVNGYAPHPPTVSMQQLAMVSLKVRRSDIA